MEDFWCIAFSKEYELFKWLNINKSISCLFFLDYPQGSDHDVWRYCHRWWCFNIFWSINTSYIYLYLISTQNIFPRISLMQKRVLGQWFNASCSVSWNKRDLMLLLKTTKYIDGSRHALSYQNVVLSFACGLFACDRYRRWQHFSFDSYVLFLLVMLSAEWSSQKVTKWT